MPAFKVSGGLLLLLIAMQMLFQKERKERLDGPLTSSLPPEVPPRRLLTTSQFHAPPFVVRRE
jgi:hypothetical protein